MKRRTFLLFVLFLASLSLQGAEPAMPVQTQRLTTGRGLSNNFVVSLDIDRYGAVWIGTEEGMNRFDGVSVHDYTQASGSIPGNNLNQVLADRNSDVVWVGTQRAGLGRYHYLTGQADLFYPDGSETGISSPEITHMEQDGNGNIWISTYLDGIDRFNPSTGAIDHFNSTNVEGMLDYRIHCFTIGADGKIYIGHYGEGVTVLDPEKRTAVRYEANGQENGLPSNIIGCVYRDPDNNIWFGTWSGLAFFRPVTRDFHVFNRENSGLPDGEIFSVMVTQDRKLLVSPDFQGVWTADLDAISGHPAFTRLPQTEELSDIGVHAMCEDASGNLWLGSYGRGVLFVGRRPKPFSAYLYPDPLSSSSVTSVAFSRDGRLIVGGEGGRIDILDRDFHRMDDPRSGDTGKSILSSLVDTDGNLWVGSFTGTTAVYDAAGRRKFQVPVVEVRCMLQQGDSLWLGTGTGLYLADRKSGNLLHRFSAQDRLPENFLRSLALDSQGRLWVGTFGRGVIVYDRNMETVAHFQTGSVSSANMVLDLLADREGRMWAATGRGLVRYDLSGPVPVVDSTFSVRTPLRSEFIRALVEDRDGDIWFATNLSICRVDRNDGEVTEFGYRNNIAPGNYQNGAAAIRDDGYLCFGSTEGITVAAAFDLVRVGEDIGDVAGIGKIGVPVSDAKDLEKVLKEAKVDVYIDFTIAKATVVNAPIAARCGVNLIIGTTGLTAEDKTMITSEVVKNNVAAVISSNYSIGVATFMKLCKQAAGLLGNDYDVEIIEAHHNQKKDAPSGTAMTVAEIISKEMGGKEFVYGREGVCPRGKEIGIHAVRGGDIVGDHTVMFIGNSERIEVRHQAHSREIFVGGAVLAAQWVCKQKKGVVYEMADVLA